MALEVDVRDQPDRNLVVLLLDMSASMANVEGGNPVTKIRQVEEALEEFLTNGMHRNSDNPKVVNALHTNGEIAVGAFNEIGGVARVDWLPLAEAPVEPGSKFYYVQDIDGLSDKARARLTPNGRTPIGEAIIEALEIIERRKNQLQEDGLTHQFRPNMFLLTDGEATSSVGEAAARLRCAEQENKVLPWFFGTPECKGEDIETLTAHNDFKNGLMLGALPLSTVLRLLEKSTARQAAQGGDVSASHVQSEMRELYDREKEEQARRPPPDSDFE